MVGVKSLASVVLSIAAVAAALARGVLSIEHLAALGPWTCALIGLFATLSVALVVGAWQLDGPSYFFLRFGRAGWTLQLPSPIQRALYGATFVCLGLIAFGPRQAQLLAAVPDELSFSMSEFCEDEQPAQPEPEPMQAPPIRGCALIRRAYELGYADSLGSCAPVVAEAERKQRELCTLRQKDEPFLHFAWRTVRDKLGGAGAALASDGLGAQVDELGTKLGYLDALAASRWQAVTTAPRSAHHVWTNLPEPGGRGRLSETDCSVRYSPPASRTDWGQGDRSALFEHALGQLLFNPKLGPVPGYCRELYIHWNAPADACERLRRDPRQLLADSGALDSVDQVLGRLRALRSLGDLAQELAQKPPPAPDPARVVSFSCFVAGGDGPRRTSVDEVSVSGETIDVVEVVVPRLDARGSAQIDVYEHVAAMLGSGMTPAAALPETIGEPVTESAVTGSDFALARLELLARSGPFDGPRWPLDRADLRELYPFDLHLRAFADRVRRQWGAQRGRL